MNNNNVYYFALGNETNELQIKQFLQSINNRGQYLNSNNIPESITSIAEYLTNILKLK